MDRAMLEDHLRQARTHVKEGREHVRRQRKIVADLERGGHDTATARQLLRTFEEMQAAHLGDMERLTKELAAFPAR